MPRFLSKNYTGLYMQKREDLFDRCLLMSPGAQFTNSADLTLAHEELYTPWRVERYSHLFDTVIDLTGESSIRNELARLNRTLPLVERISEWEMELDEGDMVLEIAGWSDMSCEIFYTDNTYTNTEYIPLLDSDTERVVPYFFEEMETCDYLSLYPDRYYPSVDRLVSRYRSKPITDPLLNENGQVLLTESAFLAEDRLLGVGSGGEYQCLEEIFEREMTEDEFRVDGSVPLLEEPDVTGGTASEEVDLLEEALHLKEELSQLSEVTDDKLRSDIKKLNSVSVSELASEVETQLEISFTDGDYGKCNESYSPRVEDLLEVLESPMVPDRSGPGLLSQLATDHPILPLTPLTAPRHFLSPGGVERCERTLRRTNQVPEEIGSMMLVEPDIPEQQYYPSIGEIVNRLGMRLDENLSSLDMELRWDPLTHYYTTIQLTQEIITKQTKLAIRLPLYEVDVDTILCSLDTEDLNKYDSLLPDLDRESSTRGDYSLVTPAATSSDWRVEMNDGISAKPKVYANDHNPELETRVRIPQIKTSNFPRVPENSRNKSSDAINPFDDIDSFLLLRQKRQSPDYPVNTSPPLNSVSHPKRVCVSESPKHSKFTVEQIPLNELYRAGLSLLMSYGDPLLKQVQEYGHLHNSSFVNLLKYPDVLQFLLREHKHQWLEQDMPTDSPVWYKLRTICQLFCLVNCGAALLATSLNAAIDLLFESVNKYKVLVQDSLVTVGNSLVGMREKVQNSFHPKIIQTIFIILHNENNLTKFSNVGIIVFDNECTFNLAGEMIGILESQVSKLSINLIKPPSNETYNHYHEVLLRAFDSSHCLLCESSTLSNENFPWDNVSLVIVYNLNENSNAISQIKERVHENCKIHFLRASMETDLVQGVSTHTNTETDNCSFIICSTSVNEEHGLLELIESNCNLFVVERDYHSLGLTNYSPDLIINESTCIILINLTDVIIDAIFKKLDNLKTAYKVCYVLAYTRSTAEYMKGDTPKVLAMLNNRMSKLEDEYCVFKLKGSTETDGIASVITGIVSQHKTSKCVTEEVEIEASEQEKWLLSLKCINSCSALALLSNYSLRELIQQELHQLKSEFSEVPQQSLALFHQICRQNYSEWNNVVNHDTNNAHGEQEMLREAKNTNSTLHDLTPNIIPTQFQVKMNDTTQSNKDAGSAKKNCNIMSREIIANTSKDSPRNATKYANHTETASLYFSRNDNYVQKSTEQNYTANRGTSNNNNSHWVHTDKVGPKPLSEGLLAFQKQEGHPAIYNSQCNTFKLGGPESNSPKANNALFPLKSDSLFPANSSSTNHINNAEDRIDSSEWSGEGMRDWRHRELSCKQVAGVTQTKLIFK